MGKESKNHIVDPEMGVEPQNRSVCVAGELTRDKRQISKILKFNLAWILFT